MLKAFANQYLSGGSTLQYLDGYAPCVRWLRKYLSLATAQHRPLAPETAEEALAYDELQGSGRMPGRQSH